MFVEFLLERSAEYNLERSAGETAANATKTSPVHSQTRAHRVGHLQSYIEI